MPLVAIGLGFDAVNGEHNRRTLSRILSQPIYRDALLFGKFPAGLFTLAVSLIVLWLLVIGLGLLGLGVPPNAEEMARALILLVVTIAYAGFWFALALLFSIIFRSAATAALVSLGVWLFLTILWPLFSPALADLGHHRHRHPGRSRYPLRCSRGCLRASCSTRSWRWCSIPRCARPSNPCSPLWASPCSSAAPFPDAPIPLLQSVLIVWPQIVGLVAGSILLFVIAYVVFQRQEVRA